MALEAEIKTIWRTASKQCEFVRLGPRELHLHLWIRGVLVLNEEVRGWAHAISRATELRYEYASDVP